MDHELTFQAVAVKVQHLQGSESIELSRYRTCNDYRTNADRYA